MAELSIQRTYAKALFEAAEDAGNVNEVGEDLSGLMDLMEEEPMLEVFLNAPTIDLRSKKESLEEMFGGRVQKETLNFLLVLVDKYRTRHLPGIVRAYKKMEDKAKGLVDGEVFSAKPLSGEQLEELQEKVSRLMGKTVRLENRVDKSLIGGLKVQVDGKLMDASIKGRLEEMRKAIRREDII